MGTSLQFGMYVIRCCEINDGDLAFLELADS